MTFTRGIAERKVRTAAPPQVQSSLLAAPQVVFNMHVWAGCTAGFHSFHPEGRRLASPRSLQHDVFEVLLEDGVLDGMKDKADIFRVYSGGEVVEERLAPVSPLTAERLHQERLEETGRDRRTRVFDRNLVYETIFVRESVFQQPGSQSEKPGLGKSISMGHVCG